MAKACALRGLGTSSLLQFHKKQNENCPNPNRHGKLRRLRVSQRASAWKQKRKAEHCHSREYSEDQLAFPVHGCFLSCSWLAHSGRAIMLGAAPDILRRKPPCHATELDRSVLVGSPDSARALVLLPRRCTAAPHGGIRSNELRGAPDRRASPHCRIVPHRGGVRCQEHIARARIIVCGRRH